MSRRRRPRGRPAVPAELTPVAEWDPAAEPVEPALTVATQPLPADEPGALVPAADAAKLTREQADWIAQHRKPCAHCQGFHQRYCPRVRELRYHPGGELAAVVFWQTFDDAFIIWPEDLAVED